MICRKPAGLVVAGVHDHRACRVGGRQLAAAAAAQLADLAAHAQDIKAALRPGGSYVAAMGCHVDSAVWPRWRQLIAETSSIAVYDHSLEDVSKAFSAAGFTVAARPLDLPPALDGAQQTLEVLHQMDMLANELPELAGDR